MTPGLACLMMVGGLHIAVAFLERYGCPVCQGLAGKREHGDGNANLAGAVKAFDRVIGLSPAHLKITATALKEAPGGYGHGRDREVTFNGVLLMSAGLAMSRS